MDEARQSIIDVNAYTIKCKAGPVSDKATTCFPSYDRGKGMKF